jgi:hypothetical protein
MKCSLLVDAMLSMVNRVLLHKKTVDPESVRQRIESAPNSTNYLASQRHQHKRFK